MDNVKRNLKRVIYTSSYDRGLDILLDIWPDVLKEVSDAELHVFYGWQLFDKFRKDNPSSMSWKAKVVEGMKQKGVTEHGRLPQKDLVAEYKKSGIWAYPTYFGEINCISAIKAQAYGCEPVVVNYAALKETVQFGRKVDGDIYDKETQVEFTKQLVDALKNPMSEEKRDEMSKWAIEKYSWENLAKSWGVEFNNG